MDGALAPGSDAATDAATAQPLDWRLLSSACAQALAPSNADSVSVGAIPLPGTLFIGLSGGVDSVVLLDLAMAWQAASAAQRPLRVVALHAHHGLQAAADLWLNACVERCSRLGIELISVRLQLGPQASSEGAAREARYNFFRRQLRGPLDCLLLAHHADDQAETLLLRVAQGRSTQGMPRSRRLGQGLLVRPLLDQRREAIEGYAQQRRLAWVEDPTNAEVVADRNFVRQRWLPQAAARWPDLVSRLRGLADRQRQQADLLSALVADLEVIPLAQAQLDTGPSLLRVWLAGLGETQVTSLALREFCDQLGSGPDREPQLRLAHGELRRYANAVHYVTDQQLAEVMLEPAGYTLVCPGQLHLPHGVLSISGPQARLQIQFAQHLKTATHLPTMKGRHWQQAGVPPWRRPSYPQVFAGSQRLGVPSVGHTTSLPKLTQTQAQTQSQTKAGQASQWQVRWEPLPGL